MMVTSILTCPLGPGAGLVEFPELIVSQKELSSLNYRSLFVLPLK
jgi:hypothetical protein